MLRVVGASNENVFKGSLRINAKAISNGLDSLMAKCALGVNVGRLEIGGKNYFSALVSKVERT